MQFKNKLFIIYNVLQYIYCFNFVYNVIYVCIVYLFINFTLEHKMNDVDNEKSFELFYQKYLEQVIIIILNM